MDCHVDGRLTSAGRRYAQFIRGSGPVIQRHAQFVIAGWNGSGERLFAGADPASLTREGCDNERIAIPQFQVHVVAIRPFQVRAECRTSTDGKRIPLAGECEIHAVANRIRPAERTCVRLADDDGLAVRPSRQRHQIEIECGLARRQLGNF